MDPSILVLRVRNNLSDVPLSYVDDSVVKNDIRRASSFVTLIKGSTILEDDVNTGIEFLASYYTYVSWTALVEEQKGEIPYSIIQKAELLRSSARAFLQLISVYPLKEDLTIDYSCLSVPIVAGVLSVNDAFDV